MQAALRQASRPVRWPIIGPSWVGAAPARHLQRRQRHLAQKKPPTLTSTSTYYTFHPPAAVHLPQPRLLAVVVCHIVSVPPLPFCVPWRIAGTATPSLGQPRNHRNTERPYPDTPQSLPLASPSPSPHGLGVQPPATTADFFLNLLSWALVCK